MATRGINPADKVTYEQYRLLPEGERYELIDGGLAELTPAPGADHQLVSRRLDAAISSRAEDLRFGLVLDAPIDVVFDDLNVVQPDILVVRQDRLGIVTREAVEGAPDLIVEVLSPSTTRRDRFEKKSLYARFGVREYWIVDPEAERFEIYQLTETGYELARLVEGNSRPVSPLLGEVPISPAEAFAPLPGWR
jgi:Uma2 family endonuclease